MTAHVHQCPKGVPDHSRLPFKHYICDQKDYYALKTIKKHLTTELLRTILRFKKELLLMGISVEFVEALLSLGCVWGRIDGILQSDLVQSVSVDGDDNRSQDDDEEDEDDNMAHTGKTMQTQHPANFQNSDCDHNKGNGVVSVSISVEDKVSVSSQVELLTEKDKEQLRNQCKSESSGKMTVLECKLCAYRSKSNKLMLRHLSRHDNGKCFSCFSCGYSTTLRHRWNQHRCPKSDKKKKTISCQSCTETFETKAALNLHVASLHSDQKDSISGPAVKVKGFVCEKCPYVGRDSSSLADHQRKHTGDYLLCSKPDCTFKTPYKRSLQKHLQQKHSTEKSFVCETCGFKSKHVTSLRAHMRLHQTSPKRYKCFQCSFSSLNSTDVLLHLRRKHLKEKYFSCSQCSFQTVYPMSLKKHLAQHEVKQKQTCVEKREWRKARVKKEYSCYFCNTVFNTKPKMLKHMKECKTVLKFEPTTTSSVNSTSIANDVVMIPVPGTRFAHEWGEINVTTTTTSTTKVNDVTTTITNSVLNDEEEREMYDFGNQLEEDISAEVYEITRNMMGVDQGVDDSGVADFTNIGEDCLSVSLGLTQVDYPHGEVAGVSGLTQSGYRRGVVGNDAVAISACKGRNPMLTETSRILSAERDDNDSPLPEESLFNLMSDFPRPPTLNRCQSASSLMFASLSLSPHLVDRPLTPDFLCDNPPGSFFQGFV